MSIEAAFAHFPTLETPRLRLRQIRPTDSAALFAIFSDAEAMRYIGRPPHTEIEQTEAWLARIAGYYDERDSIRWGITRNDDDTIIGSISFHRFGAEYHRVETGYDLLPAYWGQGIMSEAMRAVLSYGFGTLNLHRIEAIIDDANARSKALLLRLGFTYEGCLRERFLEGDQMVDEHYYRLLTHEWQQSKREQK